MAANASAPPRAEISTIPGVDSRASVYAPIGESGYVGENTCVPKGLASNETNTATSLCCKAGSWGPHHHQVRRLALSETARDRLACIVAWLLIAVIVVCVVIVVLALARRGVSIPRSPYPSTHFATTPSRPRIFYKNCDEAHKDGR